MCMKNMEANVTVLSFRIFSHAFSTRSLQFNLSNTHEHNHELFINDIGHFFKVLSSLTFSLILPSSSVHIFICMRCSRTPATSIPTSSPLNERKKTRHMVFCSVIVTFYLRSLSLSFSPQMNIQSPCGIQRCAQEEKEKKNMRWNHLASFVIKMPTSNPFDIYFVKSYDNNNNNNWIYGIRVRSMYECDVGLLVFGVCDGVPHCSIFFFWHDRMSIIIIVIRLRFYRFYHTHYV